MFKVSLQVKQQNIDQHIKKIQDKLEKVPNQAYDYFKYQAPTPVRSGNARRHTKLDNKETINADYPYAKRLEEGYSPQAPKGMSKPTIKYIQTLVKRIIKGR